MNRKVRARDGPPSVAEATFGGHSPLKKVAKETFAMFYVYILKCSDGHPYTGCTDNLKERIARHTKGYVPATKERRPIELINYIAFKNKFLAFNFEKYLKSGSGRAFIKRHFL